MVSFSCEGCNETMIKKKVAPHINWCRSSVTCIDCSQTFDGQTFKQHNQCITEDQKYQGKLYKPKPAKTTPSAENADKITQAHPEREDGLKKKSKQKSHDKKKDTTATVERVTLKISKPKSLKKVLKSLRKEHKLKKNELLDKITVTPEGQLILN